MGWRALLAMDTESNLEVRPSTDDPHEVASVHSNFARYVGNKTVPIKSLRGGVQMSDPNQYQRVHALAQRMRKPGGHISRLVVDHTGNVLEGQHRLEALRLNKHTHAPVSVVRDFSHGYDVEKIRNALPKMHPDHVNGVLGRAFETAHEVGGPQQALKKGYYLPHLFTEPFNTALSTMAAQRAGARRR
jgi:hypothetical protein